jgi:hypothetical protein
MLLPVLARGQGTRSLVSGSCISGVLFTTNSIVVDRQSAARFSIRASGYSTALIFMGSVPTRGHEYKPRR